MSSFEYAQGDRFPLVLGLRDARGQPVTPPDGSTATFRMVHRTSQAVVTGAAVLSGATATWSPGETDTAVVGLYDAQVKVVYPNEEVRHFPTKVGEAALAGLVIEVCPTA